MLYSPENHREYQKACKEALLTRMDKYPSQLNFTLTFKQAKKVDFTDASEPWEQIDAFKAHQCLTRFCNRLSSRLFTRSESQEGYRITMFGHFEGGYCKSSAGQRLHFHGRMGNIPTGKYRIAKEEGQEEFGIFFEREWCSMEWARKIVDLNFEYLRPNARTKDGAKWPSYSFKKYHFEHSERCFEYLPKNLRHLMHLKTK